MPKKAVAAATAHDRSDLAVPAKTSAAQAAAPVRRRAPRRTAKEAVPLRPRIVDDDVQVDHAEHAARDASLLDLLDRISA